MRPLLLLAVLATAAPLTADACPPCPCDDPDHAGLRVWHEPRATPRSTPYVEIVAAFGGLALSIAMIGRAHHAIAR